jgi:hypothetical protein
MSLKGLHANTDRAMASPVSVAIQGAGAVEARPWASSQRIEVLDYDRLKLDDDDPPRVVGFDAYLYPSMAAQASRCLPRETMQ